VTQKRTDLITAYLMTIPALSILLGLIIYPWIKGIYYSFTDYQLFKTSINFVWFRNYIDILFSENGRTVIVNTLLYTAYTIGIELPLGLGVAMALTQETWIMRFIRGFLIVPLLIPPTVAAIMWKVMMNPTNGVINYLLEKVGIHGIPWLTHPSTALLSVSLIDIWMFTPFVIIVIFAGLQSVRQDLVDAAEVDGANSLNIFCYITLPHLIPYLFLVLLFRVIDSLRMFDIIYGATKGGPINSTLVMHIEAYLKLMRGFDFGHAMVYTTLLWIICYVVAQFFIKGWTKTTK